ncbi:MAG: 4-hydroxy-tetrahydrodipicolinate reductase, partial [Clostridia bacterium]|nr:4-hydroxy-tetrahydrodipicolinate reductase [Clostridia bacterium]
MINILLSGANGKMGQAVTRAIEGMEGLAISAGFDINTEQKSTYPVYDKLSEV